MILYEQGKEYWMIARRCRQHKATNPAIVPTAVRDMQRLQSACHSQAVLRRINTFIAAHRTQPPGNFPEGSGPRYA